RSFPLPAHARYRFEWQTEEYELDLPYREFWATAHPVLGMTIEIHNRGSEQFAARADCYRLDSDPKKFVRRIDGGKQIYEALGPFLPYQGMFVRVEHRKEG